MSDLRGAMAALRDADAQLAALDPAPFVLPIRGLEALIAGGFSGLERSDWVFPGLRERVGAVLRGCPLERLVDGRGARPYRVAPVSTSPAARMLHACGLAMARPGETTLCFLGQGSASYGAFHEALNLAALRGLDVIFLAGRWPLDAPDAPLVPQVAGDLAALAAAHGLTAHTLDGGDAEAVRAAVSGARGAGPTFLQAHLTPGLDPLMELN